jgi:hypothetical protein
VNGVLALDDVSIGSAKVKQFSFVYANEIKSSNDIIAEVGGFAGLSPRNTSLGYHLIQEVMKKN